MRLSVALAVACLSIVGLATADDVRAAVRKSTNIPAESLGAALQQLAKDRHFQVVYVSEEVNSLRTEGAVGEFNTDEALKQLLKGTGLTYRYLDEKTVTILPASAPADTGAASTFPNSQSTSSTFGERPREERDSTAQRFLLAQVFQGQTASATPVGTGQAGREIATQQSGELQEVIVTATRRALDLEKVPLSIAALSSDEIFTRNLETQGDFLRSIPGVNQVDGGGVGGSFIILRGIETSPGNDGFASGQTVGELFGEVPLSGGVVGQTDIRLVDIDRIEVLRGPQGTEFGADSLAGTLRYIPSAPNLTQLNGNIQVGYSHTGEEGGNNGNAQLVLNLPIIDDTLAIRLVGYRFFDSGYIRNVAASDPSFVARATTLGITDQLRDGRVGDATTAGGRASLLWKPIDSLSVSLMYLTQSADQKGVMAVQSSAVPGYYDALTGPYDQTRYNFPPISGVAGSESLNDQNRIANAVVQYDLGWGTILNSYSHVYQEYHYVQDIGDFLVSVFNGNPVPSALSIQGSSDIDEVRFTSNFKLPLDVIAGLYYEDLHNHRSGVDNYGGGAAGLASLGCVSVACENDFNSSIDFHFNTIQKAAYGDIAYKITSDLTASAGTRVFRYDQSYVEELDGLLFDGHSVTALPASTQSGDVSKLNLSYQATPGSLLYATWSQGFRIGFPEGELTANCVDANGFIVGLPGIRNGNLEVTPDKVANYELGGKFVFLDSRAEINAAVYDLDWSGIPVSKILPSPCGHIVTVNAGKARSHGAELETKFALSKALTVSFNGSYTDARLGIGSSSIGNPGDRLPGAPTYSARAALQYNFSIDGHTAFVSTDATRLGSYWSLAAEQGPKLGDYTEVGLRAGVTLGSFDLLLFANNLTNTYAAIGVSNDASGTTTVLRPVDVGFNVKYRF